MNASVDAAHPLRMPTLTDLNGRFVGEFGAAEIKGLGAFCEAREYVAFGERVGSVAQSC